MRRSFAVQHFLQALVISTGEWCPPNLLGPGGQVIGRAAKIEFAFHRNFPCCAGGLMPSPLYEHVCIAGARVVAMARYSLGSRAIHFMSPHASGWPTPSRLRSALLLRVTIGTPSQKCWWMCHPPGKGIQGNINAVAMDSRNQYLTYHRIDIALDPFTGGCKYIHQRLAVDGGADRDQRQHAAQPDGGGHPGTHGAT